MSEVNVTAMVQELADKEQLSAALNIIRQQRDSAVACLREIGKKEREYEQQPASDWLREHGL